MQSFTPIGIIGVDGGGQFLWIPIRLSISSPQTVAKPVSQGRIVKTPTPKEVEIAKEKAPDFTVGGRLDKIKAENTPKE